MKVFGIDIFKKTEIIILLLGIVGSFVFAFGARSEYRVENPNIEIQKISYPQSIPLSVNKNNSEEIKGMLLLSDPYLISEIPENEFLAKYEYLNSGFMDLKISIEANKPLFRKENFYHKPSLKEKTKSLIGIKTLPTWRLIKTVKEDEKTLESETNVPGFGFRTFYREQIEEGDRFIQKRRRVKQALVFLNTSDKEINLQVSFAYIINATSVSAGGTQYFISSVPKPISPNSINSIYFYSDGKIFSYHFSDLLKFDPQLWIFKKDNQNILLVKIFVSLKPNSSVEIDPAHQVDTVAASSPACCYSFQRKTWWDGSRYWVAFWSDSDNRIEFWYSTNGSSWTENTNARLSVDTNDFSILGDSSNLFIVYNYNVDIYARQATSYPGTSFSWGSSYNIFGIQSYNYYALPYINKDSSNYLWVIARHYVSNTLPPSYNVRVARSSSANNVSSWTNQSDIGKDNTNSNKYGVIVPRNNQNMYAVWIDGTTIYGRPYNPFLGWGTTVIVASNGESGLENNMSIVHDTTNWYLHLVYVDNGASPGIYYKKYTTSWQTGIRLSTSTDDVFPTITINTNNDDLYVFWRHDTTTIMYKKGVSPYGSSDWDSTATTFRDAGSGTTTECLTSNYRDNDKIFLEWKEVPQMAITGNIMWDEVSLNSAPSVGTVILNGGNDITLTENSTTTVLATTTVTDADGYSDIASVKGKLYRTGVGNNCSSND
ncbi:hypothetical protein J7K03_01695, partial [bacterium]|nr:hypothetical protein [bacterium]